MSLSNLKPETFIILLGLFPIFFISGPFLSDLFVVVIDFFFLFYLFNLQKNEKKKFLNIFRFEIVEGYLVNKLNPDVTKIIERYFKNNLIYI